MPALGRSTKNNHPRLAESSWSEKKASGAKTGISQSVEFWMPAGFRSTNNHQRLAASKSSENPFQKQSIWMPASGRSTNNNHPRLAASTTSSRKKSSIHCPTVSRGMWGQTTDSLPSGPITCYMNSCDLLTPDLGWEAGVVTTLHSRRFHSSSVTSQGLLLIGGDDSPQTSELLAWGTNQSIPSLALPPPGRSRHCSIQMSEDIVILTGGSLPQTSNMVTELSNLGSSWQPVSRELPPLTIGRWEHACGMYISVEGETRLVVAGGFGDASALESTEVLDYVGGSKWRAAGPLPIPLAGPRPALLAGVLHITGGGNYETGFLDWVLAWSPEMEEWQVVGNMQAARWHHGVVEMSREEGERLCQHHSQL